MGPTIEDDMQRSGLFVQRSGFFEHRSPIEILVTTPVNTVDLRGQTGAKYLHLAGGFRLLLGGNLFSRLLAGAAFPSRRKNEPEKMHEVDLAIERSADGVVERLQIFLGETWVASQKKRAHFRETQLPIMICVELAELHENLPNGVLVQVIDCRSRFGSPSCLNAGNGRHAHPRMRTNRLQTHRAGYWVRARV